MSTNEAEQAVIDHLVETRGLSAEEASNTLHRGIANNHFVNAEEPLKSLVVAYKNTMGRDGRSPSQLELT